MPERLFLSLILTLAIELVYALGWKVRGRDLWIIVLMNVITNPLVVLWNGFTIQEGYLISTLLPELAAVAAEAFFLKRFGKDISYPILLAVCINTFSYVLGCIINYFL